MSSSNGKDNSGPARNRYWLKHEKPVRKIDSRPAMQRRIRAGEFTLLQTIANLGNQSDVAVLRNKPSDLLRNRAFVEHQQKLRGAIGRLAKLQRGSGFATDQVARVKGVYVMATGSAGSIPHRAEMTALKTAFQTWEDSIRGR